MINLNEEQKKLLNQVLGVTGILLISLVVILCIGPVILFGGGMELTPAFFLGLAAAIGAGMLINHGYKKEKTVRFAQAIGLIASWFVFALCAFLMRK